MIKPYDDEFIEHDDKDCVDDIAHVHVTFLQVGHEQQADLNKRHDKDGVDEKLRQELVNRRANVRKEVIASLEDTENEGDTDQNKENVDDDANEGADVDANC